MDTMSSNMNSRAGSTFGSRPTSPYVNRDTLRSHNQQILDHHNAQHQKEMLEENPYGSNYGSYAWEKADTIYN